MKDDTPPRRTQALQAALHRSAYYRRRLIYGLGVLGLITLGGTLGYHWLEGRPLIDALYMTIISMTTVGYGEIFPLSARGRVFTMLLLLTSIGTVGYVVSMLGSFILEGELNNVIQGRKMLKQINHLHNHIIICGAGPTGRRIAEEFYKTCTPFIIIEQNPDVIDLALSQCEDAVLYLQADATQDETLLMAGIERARGLAAALGDDKDNVFITLSARALNPRLHIVARVVEEANMPKLRKAGADDLVSPNAIGGLRMASLMLRPSVVNFLDEMLNAPEQTLRLEEVHISEAPGLVGQSLRAADIGRRLGLLVVAIKSPARGYRFNPGAETVLQEEDTLIVMGTPDQLTGFRTLDY